MITGVHLITGLIGSGKTLRAVWYIDQEVKAGRSVYVCNVNGLNIPGVIPFDDPTKWRDLPPGSLLVVDEAQRYWRARRAGEVPEDLQAMETSRHDAVAFLILTQQPTYLDKHLRGLVTCHEHLYRRLGVQATTVYRWARCIEDPHGASDKDGADQEMFLYPKHLYGAYKSAEQHTVKPRLGTKPKLIIAALTLSVGFFAWAFAGVFGSDDKPHSEETAGASAAPSGAPDATPSPSKAITVEQYIARMNPRIEGAPWSAPIYDRAALARPELWCMSSDVSCTCLTEQGTKVNIGMKVCRHMAKHGPVYNPFRQPAQERQQRSAGAGDKAPAAVAASAPGSTGGASIDAPQVSGYGDILAVKPEAAL